MTIEDADPPELVALAEVARRRQRRWFGIIIGITMAVGMLVGGLAATLGHRHPERHHHTSTVAAVIGLASGVLVLAITLGFVYWLAKTGKGFFKTSLLFGLPRSDRRKVLKAVRRGEPPPEPMLRTVGLRTAERTLRFRKQVFVMYGVLALSQILNAVVPGRPGGLIVLSAVGLAVFLWALLYQRVVVAGARRYTEQIRREGG